MGVSHPAIFSQELMAQHPPTAIAKKPRASRVLAEFSYASVELERGCANRSLRIDLPELAAIVKDDQE